MVDAAASQPWAEALGKELPHCWHRRADLSWSYENTFLAPFLVASFLAPFLADLLLRASGLVCGVRVSWPGLAPFFGKSVPAYHALMPTTKRPALVESHRFRDWPDSCVKLAVDYLPTLGQSPRSSHSFDFRHPLPGRPSWLHPGTLLGTLPGRSLPGTLLAPLPGSPLPAPLPDFKRANNLIMRIGV